MDVLLVHPPLLPGEEVTPPLGLCTLASWLRLQGHETRILDLDLEIKPLTTDAPERYLEVYERALRHYSPSLVAVTSMYSNSLHAERLIRRTKQVNDSIVTVAGGSHFGALGVASLQRIAELDFVIEGEGEAAFAGLLSALDDGCIVGDISRVCYRRNGELTANPAGPLLDLAELPPMWVGLEEAVDLAGYASTIPPSASRRVAYVEIGRGCPYACTFCATAPFWERRYRVKPVQRVVDEIAFLHERFGYNSVVLVHDLLTINKQYLSEFSDAMLDSRLPVEWMANSRTDIRLDGLLPKMKAAGCWKLFHGVESASRRIQSLINKHLDQDEVITSITHLGEHGIASTCSFVFGFPSETREEVSDSISLGARLKLIGAETIQFHRLRLFPPAALCRDGILSEFDPDSLRIEYPFMELPENEIAAIRSAPEFFQGYFAPISAAGTFHQLAQVEMFFHHAVVLSPMTVAALSRCHGRRLLDVFYAAVAVRGPVFREALDWEGGRIHDNWLAIRPLLETCIQRPGPDEWQIRLLRALFEYEDARAGFVSGVNPAHGAFTSERNWSAFESTFDLPQVLTALKEGRELTPELERRSLIVLSRHADASCSAFVLETSLRDRLTERDPTLMAAFA